MIHQLLVGGSGELLDNGSFNSATGWTLGSGWSIAGGKATSSGAGSLTQAVNKPAGTYRLLITISGFSGAGLYVSLGSSNGSLISASGTYTQDIVAAGSWANLGVNPQTGTENFSVESISLRRIG